MSTYLIADDHPLFREALASALKLAEPQLDVLHADSLDSTIVIINNNPDIDLILLDLHMTGSGDLYGLIRLREDYPTIPVVVISGTEQLDIISRVMGLGAMGFIPKSSSPSQISEAIATVNEGDNWLPAHIAVQLKKLSDDEVDVAKRLASLTPSQFKVFELMHKGILNKQIAYELTITEATVKAHITAIFRKLGINNRTQAVLLAEKLLVSTNIEKA